jgi:hypothetical protein
MNLHATSPQMLCAMMGLVFLVVAQTPPHATSTLTLFVIWVIAAIRVAPALMPVISAAAPVATTGAVFMPNCHVMMVILGLCWTM